jgi:uncharacterized protein (TIGR03032 family)
MADAGTDHVTIRPIFVVGATGDLDLVADTLAQAPGVWSADGSAPDVVDLVPGVSPATNGWSSGRLTSLDVTPDVIAQLTSSLLAHGRDRDDRRADGDAPVVVLDRSPMHALRVRFLAAAFPDARFVYVHRNAADSLAGCLSAWVAQRTVAYPALPDWSGPGWTGPLVPEWRDLIGHSTDHVIAVQWSTSIGTLIGDLDELPAGRWAVVAYEQLVANPQSEISRVCAFLGLNWDRTLTAPLRGRVVLADAFDAAAVTHLLPVIADVATDAADLIPDVDVRLSAAATTPLVNAFESRHSLNFPKLLGSLGVSLLVSTYQSGRLILCRADGARLNTHFRMLPVPMGIAVDATRIAVGTERRIVTYRNHPNATTQLDDDRYDACYLPLHQHVSGNIQVHELGYVADELWAVSSRFSCLVTFDDDHSFVPQWRPPFVTALVAEDRCHLNGMAIVGDRVGYVTALGLTDAPSAWRDEKGTGGVVLDVASGEPVLHTLSMPHSPRWYDDRLWVLESGKGSLAVADLDGGRLETVAELPGFTRGLAFAGAYAFVGLSQVRESVFRGLPVAQHEHRRCGVWVVDTRTGDVVASLEFVGVVQEIFDVQVLPRRWPELGELDGELLGRSFVLPSSG